MRPAKHHSGSYPHHQHPLLYVLVFLVVALGALVITLAGESSRDTGAGETPGPASPLDCTRGKPHGFALSDVEGKRLSEVEAWAAAKGMTVRVVMEDGQPMAVTMDYRKDRINTQVEAGVVTRYCGNY